MKVLITGVSGFLGNYIFQSFRQVGEVLTLGRDGNFSIKCDLAECEPCILSGVDLIIHVAGKAHVVPRNEESVISFNKVNFEGTNNLCHGIEKSGQMPKSFVFISTVAVYGLETGENIGEDAELLGTSPYAISKIRAELFLMDWCKKHNIVLTILRLPLVVGPSAPGNFGNMLKAIKEGYYFRIGTGEARRSMVLASDVAEVISHASEIGGIYNLTDGMNPSFKELDSYLASVFDKKIKVIPLCLARLLAKFGDYIPKFPLNSYKLSKMDSNLTFSSDLAKQKLNWNPRPVIGNIF
jgi:nucleoside-diphosphate-sugar epimerase